MLLVELQEKQKGGAPRVPTGSESDIDIDLPASPRVPSGSESEINLAAPSRVPPKSEADIDLGESGAVPPGATPHMESAIDLGQRGKPTHAGPPSSESDITLGSPPPVRVPDTDSGVVVNKGDSPSSSSEVQWAALVEDVTPSDSSALQIDSPSDVDLLTKAADTDSASDIKATSRPSAEATPATPRPRRDAVSEADVHLTSDSGSGIEGKQAALEDSGLIVERTSDADVVLPGDSGRIHVPSQPDATLEEVSAVNLGELHKKAPEVPSDLNLASDVLESGSSGVDLGAHVASKNGSSAEAVVELAADVTGSSNRLGEGGGASEREEHSGLDLTMLSGIESSESSSIIPESPRPPDSPAGKSAEQRRPPDEASLGEHERGSGDSAVDLGSPPLPPEAEHDGDSEWETASGVRLTQEGAAAAALASPDVENQSATRQQEAPGDEPISRVGRHAPKSREVSGASRSKSRMLVGSGLGVLVGLAISAGLLFGAPDMLASLGVRVGKAKEAPARQEPQPAANADQPPAVDPGWKEVAARFDGKSPAEIVKSIDQLGNEKKAAEQKAEDLAVKAEASEKKATELAAEVQKGQKKADDLATELKKLEKRADDMAAKAKASEEKAADLAALVKESQKKSAELAAAVKAAQKAETEAKKNAEEAKTMAQRAKDKAAEEQMARQEAMKQIEKLKADAKTGNTKQIEELTAARKAAETALQAAAKKLKDAKYLPADASPTDVPKAVEQALVAAKNADPTGKLADVQAELARHKEILTQRWTPQVMLDIWLAGLRPYPAGKDVAHFALVDAQRISKDKEASAEMRAKAACVQGLALRQQGKLDEARTVLTQALDTPAKGDWQAVAREALQEMNNPDASQAPVKAVVAQGDVNPIQAEWHFTSGVQSYWSSQYARAETQFLAAIRNDSHDARYHYYLGLSRWLQDKRAEARRDFEHGAELERQSRPSRDAINAILERVQGTLRQEVDQFRK
jgi:hypothetical protein